MIKLLINGNLESVDQSIYSEIERLDSETWPRLQSIMALKPEGHRLILIDGDGLTYAHWLQIRTYAEQPLLDIVVAVRSLYSVPVQVRVMATVEKRHIAKKAAEGKLGRLMNGAMNSADIEEYVRTVELNALISECADNGIDVTTVISPRVSDKLARAWLMADCLTRYERAYA